MFIPYIFANSIYGNEIYPWVLEPEPRDKNKRWKPVVGTLEDAKLVKHFLW